MSRNSAALLGVFVVLLVVLAATRTGPAAWAVIGAGACGLLAGFIVGRGRREATPPREGVVRPTPTPEPDSALAFEPETAPAPGPELEVQLDHPGPIGPTRLGVDLLAKRSGEPTVVLAAKGTPLPAQIRVPFATKRGGDQRIHLALHTRFAQAAPISLSPVTVLGLAPQNAGVSRALVIIDIGKRGEVRLRAASLDTRDNLPVEVADELGQLPIEMPSGMTW